MASVLGILIVFPALSVRAQDEPVAVEIHDNYYSPNEIHVPEGGTVTWTDLGGAHSVTSGDNGVTFDSNPACVAGVNCMATGDTFSHQFGGPERLTYHCRVHGNTMVGTIIVDPAGTPTTATTSTSTSTSTTTTTTLPTTTTSSDASAAPSSASSAPTVSQAPLPQVPSTASGRALPRPLAGTPHTDDVRVWALIAVALAAGTTIAGIVLVRQGRVPFG
ncbi:MAG TPA: plastocyanin/azurin family copper-binding protein [Acidimicrobiales bacterium]|nr:plastocyanin/azurin family copper-binding protein [Acidimicrobiales bacterium]